MVQRLTKSYLETEKDFAHAPFSPMNSYESDNAQVIIKETSYQLYLYSPYGFSILTPKNVFKKGDEHSLKVQIENYENEFSGVVVDCVTNQDFNLVSFRTFFESPRKDIYKEERGKKRWTCPEEYLPTGTAPNPFKYGDMMFFRIEDISHGGFRFVTSMRNKFLQRNMRFDSTIVLPGVGHTSTSFIVRHISTKVIAGKEMIVAGASFTEKDEVFLMSIAEYLINFADGVSINSLREDGFKLKNFSKFLDYSYVKSKDDYKNVLELRLNSYKAMGKVPEETSSTDMSDHYDDKARILMVNYKSKVIGSARFMYFENDKESYYANTATLTDSIPPISDCLEVASVCVDDLNRGGDIFYHVFSHAILTAIKTNRRYLLAGTDSSLLSFYTQCGCKDTGITYESKKLNSSKHHLIVMDTHAVAKGEGISLKRWCMLYANVVDFLIERDYLNPTKREMIKINLNKKLGKLMRYY